MLEFLVRRINKGCTSLLFLILLNTVSEANAQDSFSEFMSAQPPSKKALVCSVLYAKSADVFTSLLHDSQVPRLEGYQKISHDLYRFYSIRLYLIKTSMTETLYSSEFDDYLRIISLYINNNSFNDVNSMSLYFTNCDRIFELINSRQSAMDKNAIRSLVENSVSIRFKKYH